MSGYNGVILDLWGVVHNGVTATPGALATLEHLRLQGIGICLLSNSPRRRAQVAAQLAQMGIGSDRYDYLLTSGEMVFEALNDPTDSWHASLGRRCLHLGPVTLAGLLEKTNRDLVETVQAADFVVVTGTDGDQTTDDFVPVLEECASRKLPMICANPDLLVIIGERIAVCAGSIAKRYEMLGGQVRYHGKPYAGAYATSLKLLGLERSDVLAVGDSFRTDVAGANAAGIDVAFIVSGIHQEALSEGTGQGSLHDRLLDLVKLENARPQFVLPQFSW